MRLKGFFCHSVFLVLGLFLVLGIPFLCTGTLQKMRSEASPDEVSSATAVIESPDGKFLVFINRSLHKNQETLEDWLLFFKGEEVSYIFEDIACSVAESDPGAITLAESFQSRLPQNQMKIQTEDTALFVSRAEYQKFDIAIMSVEFAEKNSVPCDTKKAVDMIEIQNEQSGEAEKTQ